MPKSKKEFDFTKFKQRHVALKILYFGWDYDGLATQQDSENTIEYHLFNALTKTCLVESRNKCSYNRCGRTDKGVSSYGQVVNLNIRSCLTDETDPNNVGLFTPHDYTSDATGGSHSPKQELNYVDMLNRVLPDHIKVIAWAPVRKNFSSRFSCQRRSYSYIFPIGDLCVNSMQQALSYLVGEHDFRNLCSFDLKHGVTNHKRTILSAKIEPLSPVSDTHCVRPSAQNHYTFYQFEIVGHAFLYHQIRCIMTILFLVGTKKESPEIMRDLLDTSICTARPNYNRASPLPLCLFDCKYNPSDMPLGWFHDQNALRNLIRQLKHLWLGYKTKSMMIEQVLFDLEKNSSDHNLCEDEQSAKKPKIESGCWKDFGLECDNMSDSKYTPLLKRPRDETLEAKLEAINAKNKKAE